MRLILLAAGLLILGSVASAESLIATAHDAGQKGGHALVHGDTKAFAKVLRPFVTKDFKFSQSGQILSFDGMIAHLKQGIALLGHANGTSSTIVSCKEHGNTGIVNGTHTLIASMTGQDRKIHTMIVTGTSHDTWVKVRGNWKLQRMSWSPDKMAVDGKPVNAK